MREPRGRRLAAVAAVAAGVLVFGFRFLSNSGFSNDHFVHLARAQQMLLGGWPVRDFVDPGLPMMYVVSAAGLALLGHSLLAETLVVFLAFALAAGLTVWLASRSGVPLIWALLAVTFQVLMMPRSYSYPKLLVYAVAIAACWRVIDRPDTRRALVMAGVAVLAFLFRHDHGLFVGAAGLIAIVGSGASRLKLAAIYVAACLLLLLPWAAYVQWSLGLDRYVQSAVEFSRDEAALSRASWPGFRVDAGEGLWRPSPPAAPEARPVVYVRWRPGMSDPAIAERERALGLERIELHEGRTWRYHPDVSRLDDILADPAVEDTNHIDEARRHWWQALMPSWRFGGPGLGLYVEENSESFLYYVFLLLPLGFLAAAAFAPRGKRFRNERPGGERMKIAIVALLALAVDAVFLRNPLSARLADVVMPQTLLLAWLLTWAFARGPHGGRARRVLVPAGMLVVVCLMGTAVNAVGNVEEQFNRVGGLHPRQLAEHIPVAASRLRYELDPRLMPSRAAAELIPVFKYLQACTAPGDRFSYIGFGPDLYFYAQRGFGGGQVAWLSTYYSSDAEQRLTRDRLAAERVPIVIIPADEVSWFHRVFPIVAAHVDGRYRQIGDVSLGDRRGLVLVDSSIPARTTYGALGWPCFT